MGKCEQQAGKKHKIHDFSFSRTQLMMKNDPQTWFFVAQSIVKKRKVKQMV